jgi:methionine-rich copper-binding protein CopC
MEHAMQAPPPFFASRGAPGRRRFLAVVVAVLAAAPLPALAHAILVDSDPPALGKVAAGHVALRLRYNSRVDGRRSRLLLVRPDKSQAVLAIGPQSAENVLESEAELTPGDYTVRWQVLAVDGHITRGDLPFTVTAP